jgi:hypothetical protein
MYFCTSFISLHLHIGRNHNLPYTGYRKKLTKFITVMELKKSSPSPLNPRLSIRFRTRKELTLSSSLSSPPCLFRGRKAGTFTGNDFARLLCSPLPFGI